MFATLSIESETHNMSCGVLGVLPAPAPAEESDGEERGPEEDVGGGEDVEDPHPGQPLALNLPADSRPLSRDHSQLTRYSRYSKGGKQRGEISPKTPQKK